MSFHQSIDPKKLVTKEELDTWVKNHGKEEKGYIVSETPPEDLKIMSQLLGIPQGLGGGHFMKFVEGTECCSKCGRHYSFLDLVYTGFSAHKRQFMKDVLLGNYGYIINPSKPNLHKCYGCNKFADGPAYIYWCTYYIWNDGHWGYHR